MIMQVRRNTYLNFLYQLTKPIYKTIGISIDWHLA